MSVKGTQTEKNLLQSFAGESQARNRYTFFAKQAKKDGYEQIAAIFEETARQEEEHAKMFFRALEGGMVEITASFPAGQILDTQSNLEAAANGENEEWTELYPKFAEVAKEEGFDDIAFLFESVGAIEKTHEERFRKLLDNVNGELVFSRDNDMIWECGNCGHIHFGKKAPEFCPVCKHPQSYFKIKAQNY